MFLTLNCSPGLYYNIFGFYDTAFPNPGSFSLAVVLLSPARQRVYSTINKASPVAIGQKSSHVNYYVTFHVLGGIRLVRKINLTSGVSDRM